MTVVITPRLSSPAPLQILEGGRLFSTLDQSAARARCFFAGDWAPVREFEGAAQTSLEQLYGHVLPHIRAADMSMVNLEMPLAIDQPIVKDGPNFGGRPEYAQALAAAGFTIAGVANNHLRDQGDAAVLATLEACHAAGLKTVGGGIGREQALAPLFIDHQGLRIGVMAATDPGDAVATHEHGGAADINDPLLPLLLQQAKASCDCLILSVHGGIEYSPLPPPYWRDLLISLIAAGADAVVAHHPHVPQGMSLVERPGRGPAPIFWSLGNFIFPPRAPDHQKPPYMHDGYTVTLGLAHGQVTDFVLCPYHIDNGFGLRAPDCATLDWWSRYIMATSEMVADTGRHRALWDQFVLRSWRVHACERVRGLTEMLCAGDIHGLRHGQSHFNSPSHFSAYGRACELLIAGVRENPEEQQRLEAWIEGVWPN
ncbi:MAG: CapA family protein [Planctomycetota bacterium]|nr:MAG: CapA family protein [Planctomycetota bacterium]